MLISLKVLCSWWNSNNHPSFLYIWVTHQLLGVQVNLLPWWYEHQLLFARYYTGQEIGQVEAADADGDVITYTISGSSRRYFVDNSGVVYLIQSLGATTDIRNEFIVTATDNGTPSRSTNITVCLLPYIIANRKYLALNIGFTVKISC